MIFLTALGFGGGEIDGKNLIAVSAKKINYLRVSDRFCDMNNSHGDHTEVFFNGDSVVVHEEISYIAAQIDKARGEPESIIPDHLKWLLDELYECTWVEYTAKKQLEIDNKPEGK